jgi:hypothetical protein
MIFRWGFAAWALVWPVLDLNGGRITGVAYGSTAPVDRQLGDLPLVLGEKTSLTEFLSALRGARLEVKSGAATITGRLLSVERKTRMGGGATLEVDYLSLLSDNGELRTTELSPSFSVRLLEKGLPAKVDRYLDLASARREADLRRMVISTEGSGERNLFVSYISEVPVWKATYRIVLSSKAGQKPLLQGWAIVDNTVGQDWENVQLSLVAGAPQSFIQNLSQPYYSRRPVVPLPESVNNSPQTFEATLMPGSAMLSGVVTDPAGAAVAGASVKAYDSSGSLAGQASTNPAGAYEFRMLPEGPVRLEIELAGFVKTVIPGIAISGSQPVRRDARLQVGAVSESVTVTAAAPQELNASTSSVASVRRSRTPSRPVSPVGLGRGIAPSLIETARSGAQAAAFAQELGDLFEYKLKEPISILKNRSALAPIVQSSIDAEKVSIWNEQAGSPRPQRALWLANSSGLTLDGGSFSVLEEETFAGEGIFEPIRPGEKRLVSYATDLALNVNSRQASDQQRVTRVRVSHGVMTHESEVREKKTYTFRNEDSSPRSVIVEHPARAGYELRSDARPIESTAGWMRFRLQVNPKQTVSLEVDEARPIQTTYELNNINQEQVALFVKQKSIDKTVEEALRKIMAQQEVINSLSDQKSDRDDEATKMGEDQERIRKNMEALKGSAEEKALLQRYVKLLNEQENRLEELRRENKQIETRQEAAQAALDKMIQELSFDVRL